MPCLCCATFIFFIFPYLFIITSLARLSLLAYSLSFRTVYLKACSGGLIYFFMVGEINKSIMTSFDFFTWLLNPCCSFISFLPSLTWTFFENSFTIFARPVNIVLQSNFIICFTLKFWYTIWHHAKSNLKRRVFEAASETPV